MKSVMCAAAGCILLPCGTVFGGFRVLPAKTDVPYAKGEPFPVHNAFLSFAME